MRLLAVWAVVAAGVVAACGAPAQAFEVAYLDGGSWNSIYAQGFSPSVGPNPNPGLGAGDAVYLESFEFFKSGNADASNLRLAIIDPLFANLDGLSTTHAAFVGLSNNTIATTGAYAVGAAIPFDFGGLPLTYGSNYGAVLVTLGGDMTTLTPTLGPMLVTNYVESPPGSGTYKPATNYGTENQFDYAVSNFIATNEFGSFFNVFTFAGDANFRAVFSVPEPTGLLLALCGGLVGWGVRRGGRR